MQSEVNIRGHKKPWEVDNAPESYIEILKKAIMGIEMEMTDIGGKYKMSQEMCAGDGEGIGGSRIGRWR